MTIGFVIDFTYFYTRYILYDINPGEGFNLRRDVFVRIAVMVKKMNENSSKFSYTLVLPPWGPLYHWQTKSLGDQTKIPWKNFFDVESISRYVPSLDFEDYLKSKFHLYYSKITDEKDINLLKFIYSEYATKFDKITLFVLREISSNFCGLLRKPQL